MANMYIVDKNMWPPVRYDYVEALATQVLIGTYTTTILLNPWWKNSSYIILIQVAIKYISEEHSTVIRKMH